MTSFDSTSPAPHGGLTPDSEASVRFTLHLGEALHRYGTPAHRLEEVMTVVSEQLGLTGRFISTPTGIHASFGPPEDLRGTHIRIQPGEMNLDRLAQLDKLTTDVIERRITPAEGARRIDAILAAPPLYSRWVTVLCFGLAAATGAHLFGGGLREIAAGGVLGLALGLFAVIAERRKGLARVFEPVAAFAVSVLSVVGTRLVGGYSTEIATLAALVYLLPGLMLAVAMIELATRNLISGTSRLIGAALVFLQLGFGVALGRRVDLLLPPEPPHVVEPLPSWTIGPVLVVITLALAVLFRVRLRHSGLILAAGALAYLGSRVGSHFLGPQLGAFVGAALLGMGSNTFSRIYNLPSVITLIPGFMLLVPGAIGFRSLESMMGQDVIQGVSGAFFAIMVTVAMGAGTLLANALVPPRRIL